MTLRGSVETIGLVDLLQLIQGSAHSGTLKAVAGDTTSKLYFYKGQLYLPTSGAGGALKVGALLVRAKKITGKDLLRALQLQAAGGGAHKLGEVLVREGLVKKEEHDAIVRRLYEEDVYDLLFRENAYFEWKRDVLPAGFMDAKGNVKALHFDTRSILMEASRRQDEWRRIRTKIPTTKAIYRTSHPDEPRLQESEGVIEHASPGLEELPPDARVAQRIVELLKKAGVDVDECPFDGARNLDDVIGITNLSAFEALGVIIRLRDENLVRPISAPEIEPRAHQAIAEERFADAYKLYAWANEIERLRRISSALDKELLHPVPLQRAGKPAFAGRTGGARALQILSRLLRRGAPFQFHAREEESAIDVFVTAKILRLHLMGPRRTHSATRYLRARGAVSDDELKRAREISKRTGGDLDRVLLDEKLVTREQWLLAVKDKVVSALFSIFEWSDPFVEASAEPDIPLSGEEPRGLIVEIPLDEELREDLRKDLLRWKAILEAVPSPDVIFVCAKPTPGGAKHLHDLADGRRNVADLLALAKVAPLELVRFLLEALLDRRIRRLTDREHRDRLETSVEQGNLDDAIAYAKSAVAFGFSSDEYRRRIVELRDRSKGQPAAEGRPTVQGELGQVSLAEVLQLLHTGKRSGTLRITSGAQGGSTIEKTLYMDRGEVYILNVEGPAPDAELQELLGESAVDRLGRTARIQAERGSSISEDDVAKTEVDRIKNELFEAFLWEGARFEFLQNFLPPEIRTPSPNSTRLALKTEALLFEAMQRLAEWDDMRMVLKSAHAVFRFATSENKAEAITGDDGALAYLFDGDLSLADVVRRSGEDRFRVYRFASALVRKGALIYSHHKTTSTADATGTRRIVASGRFQTIPPADGAPEPDKKAPKIHGSAVSARAFPGLAGVADRTDDSIHELAPHPGDRDPKRWGERGPPAKAGSGPPTPAKTKAPASGTRELKGAGASSRPGDKKSGVKASKIPKTEELESIPEPAPVEDAERQVEKKRKLGKSSTNDAKKGARKWGGPPAK
jgi:hypothetical protein